MTDAHMLELIATGASLAADFLKVRQERGESHDAAAFQEWLRRDAFPQLLAQSDHTLRSVISLKATQQERYDELLDHVLAIRRAVVEPKPTDEWSALSDVDRGILMHVYEKSRDDPFEHCSEEELEKALKTDGAIVAKSARYLAERGWLKHAEWAGGWSVAPQAAGVCLAWEVADAQEYADAIGRLAKALPAHDETERLRTLAEETDVSIGLTYFVISQWAQQNHLTFEDNAAPYDGALIYNVREAFLRSTRDE